VPLLIFRNTVEILELELAGEAEVAAVDVWKDIISLRFLATMPPLFS
jgi:hypothetical protein